MLNIQEAGQNEEIMSRKLARKYFLNKSIYTITHYIKINFRVRICQCFPFGLSSANFIMEIGFKFIFSRVGITSRISSNKTFGKG